LAARRQTLTDAKSRLIAIENEISQGQNLLPSGEAGTGDTLNLDQLNNQLKQLQSRYTDRHPDIIRLKEKIADLEKESVVPVRNRQMEDTKKVIKALEKEITDIQNQIKIYEIRVEETPKREQELLSLRRDYDNISENYNSMLARKLEAELAVNLEKKQQREQFSIIDPARLPEKPSSTDLNKIFLFFIAAGLCIPGGLIYLLEHLDSSFKKPDDIESHLGLPVLATVPAILHPGDIRMKKLNQVLSIFFIIVAIALLAGLTSISLLGFDLESLKSIT